MLTTLLTFSSIILPLNCFFIFFFKKWLGPIATFYSSLLSIFICLLFTINELLNNLTFGNYFFIDFGRFFFCLDTIDSHLVFCLDTLGLISASLVLTLTALALYFGVEYMYREAFINRLLYLLNMFATSVVFLFFCYDFFLIILIWECIGLFSFLLVNFYSIRIYTIKAALKTFVFSRISDLFMFLSFILAILFFNTTDLSLIFLQIPFFSFHYVFFGSKALHFLSFFSFCIVTSGVIKAAQFFFHVWLPDAMEAPTPASALIHSSTLVVAGVFLVIRFSVLLEFSIWVNFYLALLGAITLAFGAITATFQQDIKKLVAYSTISQIGYLVCGCGFCCYEEVLLYLIIHALNKAFLFILVGYLVHFFNANTDMRQMGGSYLYSFDISVFLFGVCFNLAGLPYSAGFLGKEFLLFQVLRDDFFSYTIRACWLVSFFFTPIYMFILVFSVLFGIKKSTVNTYISFWSFNYYYYNFLFFSKKNLNNLTSLFNQSFRFQYTSITSLLTSYILFFFWIFFFFFGEMFLLILFNFSTISDSISGSYFLNFKYFIIFDQFFLSSKTSDFISFFILFFTTSSFLFLINLRYTFFYKSLNIFFLTDIFFCFFIFFLSNIWIAFLIFLILTKIRSNF